MSDLISRQKALEHLRKRLIQTANNNVGFVCDAGSTFEDASERVKTWLDEVPSIDAVPQWVPVEEGLPKPGEYIGDVARYYLVQNEYGDMMVARYSHSEYWEQIYQLQPITDTIVAWMPLPKPYEAERKEE